MSLQPGVPQVAMRTECRRGGKPIRNRSYAFDRLVPRSGYYRHSGPQSRTFFAGLLDWAGIRQKITSSDPLIRARLHTGGGGNVLYVVNPTREERVAFIAVPQTVRSATDVWQNKDVKFVGQRLQVT